MRRSLLNAKETEMWENNMLMNAYCVNKWGEWMDVNMEEILHLTCTTVCPFSSHILPLAPISKTCCLITLIDPCCFYLPAPTHASWFSLNLWRPLEPVCVIKAGDTQSQSSEDCDNSHYGAKMETKEWGWGKKDLYKNSDRGRDERVERRGLSVECAGAEVWQDWQWNCNRLSLKWTLSFFNLLAGLSYMRHPASIDGPNWLWLQQKLISLVPF